MRALLQRVRAAEVTVDSRSVGKIDRGFLVFLGVGRGDEDKDVELLVQKIAALRAFPDEQGKMNLDLKQTGGALLLVSQFTLFADLWQGNRPSFGPAEKPERARELFERAALAFRARGLTVATGEFGADMQVSLINDGPVTFWIDSRVRQD